MVSSKQIGMAYCCEHFRCGMCTRTHSQISHTHWNEKMKKETVQKSNNAGSIWIRARLLIKYTVSFQLLKIYRQPNAALKDINWDVYRKRQSISSFYWIKMRLMKNDNEIKRFFNSFIRHTIKFQLIYEIWWIILVEWMEIQQLNSEHHIYYDICIVYNTTNDWFQ